MANITATHQQINTFSINRESFLNTVVKNENLSENDLRVLCFLLTQLDGFKYEKISHMKDGSERRSWNNDPKNYKNIDIKKIAKILNISKKEAKHSVKNLLREYIIEKGSSNSITDGYRFLF